MSPSKMTIGADPTAKVLSPTSLAHVVFRTANYEEMVSFWVTFLGASITHKDQNLAFLRYDEEHHRIAVINIPETVPRVPTAAGMHHLAFAFNTLPDLVTAYQQRKARGITPSWCVNHGPTTSMYYVDPDGNSIETQVDNFETVEDANEFMSSAYFAENPIGTDFEAEELVQRLASGVHETEIKKRIEIGPRLDLGNAG